MRLQMRGVDHDPLRPGALARQFGEDRGILPRRVTPAKPIPDHEHDDAHNPPVIHPRDAVRQRKIALDAAHLRFRKQNKSAMAKPPRLAYESADPTQGKKFNGSLA